MEIDPERRKFLDDQMARIQRLPEDERVEEMLKLIVHALEVMNQAAIENFRDRLMSKGGSDVVLEIIEGHLALRAVRDDPLFQP
jgi:hypothetical protein